MDNKMPHKQQNAKCFSIIHFTQPVCYSIFHSTYCEHQTHLYAWKDEASRNSMKDKIRHIQNKPREWGKGFLQRVGCVVFI